MDSTLALPASFDRTGQLPCLNLLAAIPEEMACQPETPPHSTSLQAVRRAFHPHAWYQRPGAPAAGRLPLNGSRSCAGRKALPRPRSVAALLLFPACSRIGSGLARVAITSSTSAATRSIGRKSTRLPSKSLRCASCWMRPRSTHGKAIATVPSWLLPSGLDCDGRRSPRSPLTIRIRTGAWMRYALPGKAVARSDGHPSALRTRSDLDMAGDGSDDGEPMFQQVGEWARARKTECGGKVPLRLALHDAIGHIRCERP
jgi:hypothetical protein